MQNTINLSCPTLNLNIKINLITHHDSVLPSIFNGNYCLQEKRVTLRNRCKLFNSLTALNQHRYQKADVSKCNYSDMRSLPRITLRFIQADYETITFYLGLHQA